MHWSTDWWEDCPCRDEWLYRHLKRIQRRIVSRISNIFPKEWWTGRGFFPGNIRYASFLGHSGPTPRRTVRGPMCPVSGKTIFKGKKVIKTADRRISVYSRSIKKGEKVGCVFFSPFFIVSWAPPPIPDYHSDVNLHNRAHAKTRVASHVAAPRCVLLFPPRIASQRCILALLWLRPHVVHHVLVVASPLVIWLQESSYEYAMTLGMLIRKKKYRKIL